MNEVIQLKLIQCTQYSRWLNTFCECIAEVYFCIHGNNTGTKMYIPLKENNKSLVYYCTAEATGKLGFATQHMCLEAKHFSSHYHIAWLCGLKKLMLLLIILTSSFMEHLCKKKNWYNILVEHLLTFDIGDV